MMKNQKKQTQQNYLNIKKIEHKQSIKSCFHHKIEINVKIDMYLPQIFHEF